TGAVFLGTVGLDWQVAGFGPMHAAGESDMVLRNVNTGAFLAYDIGNNQIMSAAGMGQIAMDWQLGGFAADASASSASMSQTSQLVQAMAGFSGGRGGAGGRVYARRPPVPPPHPRLAVSPPPARHTPAPHGRAL